MHAVAKITYSHSMDAGGAVGCRDSVFGNDRGGARQTDLASTDLCPGRDSGGRCVSGSHLFSCVFHPV